MQTVNHVSHLSLSIYFANEYPNNNMSTFFTGWPRGCVQFEVTEALNNWYNSEYSHPSLLFLRIFECTSSTFFSYDDRDTLFSDFFGWTITIKKTPHMFLSHLQLSHS